MRGGSLSPADYNSNESIPTSHVENNVPMSSGLGTDLNNGSEYGLLATHPPATTYKQCSN